MSSTQSQLPVVDKADGNVASTAPAIATQVGAVFNTTQPTVTNGQLVAAQATARGAQIVATGVDSFIVNSRIALTASSPTSASVGVTSASALALNANRKGLVLINVSNNRISIAFGVAAVLNSGITLYPGGIFVMDDYLFNTAQVFAIASIAASGLAIQEYI